VFLGYCSNLYRHKLARILLLVSSLLLCSKSISDNQSSALLSDFETDDLSIQALDINNHYDKNSHADLMETADQLFADGHFPESEIVFKQLFASVRANNGLFHEQQFVVLDRLLAINLARADWQNLKQHLDYHGWLLNRLYANQPDQLAEHLEINASHHERAAQAFSGPARNWHLVQIRHQLWRAVSALETMPAESSRLPPLLHKITMHHYALSRQTDLRWLTSFETRTDEPAMISGWAFQGNDMTKRSYQIGAELIVRIVRHYELNPHSNLQVQAALMAQLLAFSGDWEILFERERNALAFYEQSLSLTELTSCKEEIQRILFGTAVQLPVQTLPVDTQICTSGQGPDRDTEARPETDLSLAHIYRPRWQDNHWLMGILPSALSSLDMETQND
jgi:hypothetical protein